MFSVIKKINLLPWLLGRVGFREAASIDAQLGPGAKFRDNPNPPLQIINVTTKWHHEKRKRIISKIESFLF
jgi:hypothetical protein